jgi:thioester reductase-like protein
METLASRYSTFTSVSPASGSGSGSDIVSHDIASTGIADDQLLTGATGSLGVHLLHRLSSNSPGNDGKIICLVRAQDDEAARSRILDIVSARGLQIDESRLVALAADVTREKLGLSASVYDSLVKTVETVIHVSILFTSW